MADLHTFGALVIYFLNQLQCVYGKEGTSAMWFIDVFLIVFRSIVQKCEISCFRYTYNTC